MNKFKLEHKSDDQWLQHGEYETGIKEEDDHQKAHHIKLERPVISSQVRIVIEESMVTDKNNIVGRVGFVAAPLEKWLIKRAIDDFFIFKQADQVSKLLTTSWFGLEIFSRCEAYQNAFGKSFDDLMAGSRAEMNYFKNSINNWSELLKKLIDAADLNQWLSEKP